MLVTARTLLPLLLQHTSGLQSSLCCCCHMHAAMTTTALVLSCLMQGSNGCCHGS